MFIFPWTGLLAVRGVSRLLNSRILPELRQQLNSLMVKSWEGANSGSMKPKTDVVNLRARHSLRVVVEEILAVAVVVALRLGRPDPRAADAACAARNEASNPTFEKQGVRSVGESTTV
jgi:hypothetical protein